MVKKTKRTSFRSFFRPKAFLVRGGLQLLDFLTKGPYQTQKRPLHTPIHSPLPLWETSIPKKQSLHKIAFKQQFNHEPTPRKTTTILMSQCIFGWCIAFWHSFYPFFGFFFHFSKQKWLWHAFLLVHLTPFNWWHIIKWSTDNSKRKKWNSDWIWKKKQVNKCFVWQEKQKNCDKMKNQNIENKKCCVKTISSVKMIEWGLKFGFVFFFVLFLENNPNCSLKFWHNFYLCFR